MEIKKKQNKCFEVVYSTSESITIRRCEVNYAAPYEKKLGLITFYGSNDKIISQIEVKVEVYNSQFPIPISYDGAKVFVQSWEKPGLRCYSVAKGSLIWTNRQLNKVNDVLVLNNLLLCFIQETGVVLVDADTGEIIKWILRGYDIDFLYRITDEIAVCWYTTKSKLYYYDIRNDVLYLSPIDFGIKSRLKELVANDEIYNFSRYNLSDVEDLGDTLKVEFFVPKKSENRENDLLNVSISKSNIISNGEVVQ